MIVGMSDEPGTSLEDAVHTLLAEIGEDPERGGLVRTPERVRRMYAELTEGYRTDPDALINGATQRIRVCTNCIRSGKIQKSVSRRSVSP